MMLTKTLTTQKALPPFVILTSVNPTNFQKKHRLINQLRFTYENGSILTTPNAEQVIQTQAEAAQGETSWHGREKRRLSTITSKRA